MTNFLPAAHADYSPIMLQVQLIEAGGAAAATPAPNKGRYFTEDHWLTRDEAYEPVAADSVNDLYVMTFGARKAKAAPSSDYWFEHEQANVRKWIRRIKAQVAELMTWQRS